MLNPILILSQSPGNPHGQTLLAMVQRVPFGSHAIVIHVTARGRNLTSPRPPSLFTSASDDCIEKTKHTPSTECCSVNVQHILLRSLARVLVSRVTTAAAAVDPYVDRHIASSPFWDH